MGPMIKVTDGAVIATIFLFAVGVWMFVDPWFRYPYPYR